MKILTKKAQLGGALNVDKILGGIIGLIVLFGVLQVAIPLLNTSGDALNASGVPFGAFFASGGIVIVIIMAAVLGGILLLFGRGRGR